MKIFLFILAYIILGFAEIVLTAFVYSLRYDFTFKVALERILRDVTGTEPEPIMLMWSWPFFFIRSIGLLIMVGYEILFDKLADLLEGRK